MDSQSPDSAPTALADLIAAGLVSYEMIGDPARLGGEAEVLRVLCGLVSGPIWRIEPFHYAFRADGDGTALEDRAAALQAALQGELGPEAVWVNAADLLPEAAELDQPLLLLRAHEAAVAGALAAAGPDLQAVINARFAAETARLTASLEPGSALAHRLAVIETRQEEILEMLVARAEDGATEAATGAATLDRLDATLAATLERLDAQASALAVQAPQIEILAGRAALAAPDSEARAFRTDLALTLAEFLARLEQAADGRADVAQAPALAPRLG